MINDFFDYFQLVALFVFLFMFVGRSLYLRLVKKINPIALGSGKHGLRRLVEISFLFGLTAWVAEIMMIALRHNWRAFPIFLQTQLINIMPVKILGVSLITSGVIIFALALISFGASWRVGIDEKKPGALVTTGIFAISRNPIFVFLNLYTFSTFLINGTLGFLIFALIFGAGIHYQILQEENFLRRTYGRAYEDYYAGTSRYFGWRKIFHKGKRASRFGATRSPA
jgi:protein-S-isoprenylcysteine O-methyltransferase Ste14